MVVDCRGGGLIVNVVLFRQRLYTSRAYRTSCGTNGSRRYGSQCRLCSFSDHRLHAVIAVCTMVAFVCRYFKIGTIKDVVFPVGVWKDATSEHVPMRRWHACISLEYS